SDVEIMHGEVGTVAFPEHRALGVRGLELAALRNCFAVRPDDPLRDIKAAAVALRQAKRDIHLVAPGGVPQPFGFRPAILQRVVEIARYETAHDRPGRSAEPDPPWVTGKPGFQKRDQL